MELLYAVIAVAAGLSVIIFFREKINKIWFTVLVIIIIPVYLYLVLQITMLGRNELDGGKSELIPFMSYYMLPVVGWRGWGVYIFYGLVGNIIIFVPVGMLIALLPKVKHKYLLSGIIGFVFSLAIEIIQYCTMLGTFEVDDLIHNTWGAVIGCAIALALMRKDKRIKTNIRTLMPLIVFIILIASASILSIGRDIFARL